MAASRCVQNQVFSMLSLKDENKNKFGKNRFALHRLRAEQICVFFLRVSHPSRMCGLKFVARNSLCKLFFVTSFTDVWIEI